MSSLRIEEIEQKKIKQKKKFLTQFNVSKQKYCGCCKRKRSIRQFKTPDSEHCIDCS